MPQIERSDISFESADRRSTIKGALWRDDAARPWCVLQIAHGMAEYVLRYVDFAEYLAAAGVVVAGTDHIGHGHSVPDAEDLGYFGERDGRRYALEDMHTLNRRLRAEYPGLPLVLLGHSMGSFFARKYATQWPHSIAGLIISGTGGPNPLAGVGMAMARRVARLEGERARSKRLQVLAFGSYLDRIENPRTPYDWLSRDTDIVDAYVADPLAGYRFTANGYQELCGAVRDVSGRRWAEGIAKDMPVFIFSGDADPVGDYGKGVLKVYEWLRQAGVQDLQLQLYPGGRHEMLNETNRAEVYADVLHFLRKHWAPEQEQGG